MGKLEVIVEVWRLEIMMMIKMRIMIMMIIMMMIQDRVDGQIQHRSYVP